MTTNPITARQSSPRALATRSLTAATRLNGKKRTEALQQHAAMVWPTQSCTLTDRTTRL